MPCSLLQGRFSILEAKRGTRKLTRGAQKAQQVQCKKFILLMFVIAPP